jgi:predicted GIY-YIG superfamily endonuclease
MKNQYESGYGGRSLDSQFSWTVYTIQCNDGTRYVGKSSNLNNRLQRHASGHVSYTSSRLPVKLNVFTSFDDEWKATEFEKYLKSGSGRAFAKKHYY